MSERRNSTPDVPSDLSLTEWPQRSDTNAPDETGTSTCSSVCETQLPATASQEQTRWQKLYSECHKALGRLAGADTIAWQNQLNSPRDLVKSCKLLIHAHEDQASTVDCLEKTLTTLGYYFDLLHDSVAASTGMDGTEHELASLMYVLERNSILEARHDFQLEKYNEIVGEYAALKDKYELLRGDREHISLRECGPEVVMEQRETSPCGSLNCEFRYRVDALEAELHRREGVHEATSETLISTKTKGSQFGMEERSNLEEQEEETGEMSPFETQFPRRATLADELAQADEQMSQVSAGLDPAPITETDETLEEKKPNDAAGPTMVSFGTQTDPDLGARMVVEDDTEEESTVRETVQAWIAGVETRNRVDDSDSEHAQESQNVEYVHRATQTKPEARQALVYSFIRDQVTAWPEMILFTAWLFFYVFTVPMRAITLVSQKLFGIPRKMANFPTHRPPGRALIIAAIHVLIVATAYEWVLCHRERGIWLEANGLARMQVLQLARYEWLDDVFEAEWQWNWSGAVVMALREGMWGRLALTALMSSTDIWERMAGAVLAVGTGV